MAIEDQYDEFRSRKHQVTWSTKWAGSVGKWAGGPEASVSEEQKCTSHLWKWAAGALCQCTLGVAQNKVSRHPTLKIKPAHFLCEVPSLFLSINKLLGLG